MSETGRSPVERKKTEEEEEDLLPIGKYQIPTSSDLWPDHTKTAPEAKTMSTSSAPIAPTGPPLKEEDPDEKDSLAAFLKRHAPVAIYAMNARDWEFTLPHLAESVQYFQDPDFRVQFDAIRKPMTFYEHVDEMRMLVAKDPTNVIFIKSMETNINEKKGTAAVHMELSVRGLDGMGNAQAWGVINWKVDEEGKWRAASGVGMRAPDFGEIPR